MIIIFFLFGLIVGSFLNVVISRLPRMESLLGRSHCPKCKAQIRWYDNIPLLSYAVLGTRCRDCREKISWQYPLVEGAAGIIFALTSFYFFNPLDTATWFEAFFYLIIFSLLLVVFVYDLKHMEIPMIVVWLGVGIAVAYYLAFDWANFQVGASVFSMRIFSGMLAGIGAFLFFFLLAAGSREKWMGLGDAYAGLLIGLTVRWPEIFIALVMAFSLGAAYGIILISSGQKTLKSQVPFAPFLITGAFLAVMLPKIFPYLERLFWFF